MPPLDSFAFVLFALGLALTFGGWLAFTTVAVRYGLHSSSRFARGLRELFSKEATRDRRRAGLFVAITFAGMPLWMVGVLMGDDVRNAPCADACQEAGYRGGHLRGSPHDVVDGVSQGPRACWCYRRSGRQDYAPEPLDLVEGD